MRKIGILAMARQGNGGTLLYTHSMIEALQRLSPDYHSLAIYTQDDNHEYDTAGIPITRLPSAPRIAMGKCFGKGLFKDVDVVLAPIYSTVLLASTKPFAFTLHDMQERYLPENFGPATRLWRHVTNRLLTTRATRVICESNFVKNDIIRFLGVEPEKVIVIPAPPVAQLCDYQLDPVMVAKARDRFALPLTYLFYPAQFWLHKNHLRLVEAFALIANDFPEADLVFTGKKRDEFVKVFQRGRELGLTDRIHHVGHVEQAELGALYCGATLVVIPTLFESISIPVYEAFALGIPICASNVVALPDQVGDAGILFDPLSVEDIAEKISLALRDPELRTTLAARGKERIAAVGSEQYSHRLAEVIDALRVPPMPPPLLSRAKR